MEPFFSIIIPFFGSADTRLLDRCVESIHHQGLPESAYEIIVCDEGEGQGVYAARNVGMRRATGKYLFFVDADDWIYPNTLSSCMSILQQAKPDMLTFEFKQVSATDTSTPKQPTLKMERYMSGAYFMANHNYFGVIWRFMIRRELVEKQQLHFVERRHHQDEIFCAECYFVAHTLIHINTIVYAYCQHKNSLVHRNTQEFQERRMADYRNILTELCLFLHRREHKSKLQVSALERRIHFLTICYLLELRRNHCPLSRFKQELKELRAEHFLPLPDRPYTWKYDLARMVINPISYFFR